MMRKTMEIISRTELKMRPRMQVYGFGGTPSATPISMNTLWLVFLKGRISRSKGSSTRFSFIFMVRSILKKLLTYALHHALDIYGKKC